METCYMKKRGLVKDEELCGVLMNHDEFYGHEGS